MKKKLDWICGFYFSTIKNLKLIQKSSKKSMHFHFEQIKKKFKSWKINMQIRPKVANYHAKDKINRASFNIQLSNFKIYIMKQLNLINSVVTKNGKQIQVNILFQHTYNKLVFKCLILFFSPVFLIATTYAQINTKLELLYPIILIIGNILSLIFKF